MQIIINWPHNCPPHCHRVCTQYQGNGARRTCTVGITRHSSPQNILPPHTQNMGAVQFQRSAWLELGTFWVCGTQGLPPSQPSAQALGALRATKSPRRALAPQAPVDSRSLLTTSRPSSATFGQILLHGFVEVVTWISQSYYMYLSRSAAARFSERGDEVLQLSVKSLRDRLTLDCTREMQRPGCGRKRGRAAIYFSSINE